MGHVLRAGKARCSRSFLYTAGLSRLDEKHAVDFGYPLLTQREHGSWVWRVCYLDDIPSRPSWTRRMKSLTILFRLHGGRRRVGRVDASEAGLVSEHRGKGKCVYIAFRIRRVRSMQDCRKGALGGEGARFRGCLKSDVSHFTSLHFLFAASTIPLHRRREHTFEQDSLIALDRRNDPRTVISSIARKSYLPWTYRKQPIPLFSPFVMRC